MEALPDSPPIPKNNPQTEDKIELGRQLYFDKRLSKDNTVSCNTCHNASGSGTDNLPTSTGIKGQKGGRNSPTVLNSAFMSVQFWDGRAKSLEEQAKGPLTNPIEMGMENHDEVVKRVKADPKYIEQFTKVFGKNRVNIDNIARAIASFERTLITPNSPFDQFMKGNKNALTAEAQRGMKKVQEVGCMACHMGPNFAGPTLPEGTGFYQKFPMIADAEIEKKYEFSKDQGRYEVTKNENDRNLFRVQSWRNIALTAPYFHNGKVKDLGEAVRVMAKTQLGRTLTKDEISDIVAFLKSLTGDAPKLKK
ncbi:MAG: cytochrome-c peroxidase [Xanthomonadaceae bacterium]|nr:cytochrome-c peroxidase [Xanthomonadaceae bacterium]